MALAQINYWVNITTPIALLLSRYRCCGVQVSARTRLVDADLPPPSQACRRMHASAREVMVMPAYTQPLTPVLSVGWLLRQLGRMAPGKIMLMSECLAMSLMTSSYDLVTVTEGNTLLIKAKIHLQNPTRHPLKTTKRPLQTRGCASFTIRGHRSPQVDEDDVLKIKCHRHKTILVRKY